MKGGDRGVEAGGKGLRWPRRYDTSKGRNKEGELDSRNLSAVQLCGSFQLAGTKH